MASLKTAVSLPEDVFAQGEVLAKRLGLKRSELYAKALSEFLARHSKDEITARLNEIYLTEPSALAPGLARLQADSLENEDWS